MSGLIACCRLWGRGFAWLLVIALSIASGPSTAQTDPLPSWNDGGAKTAILAFVDKVTRQGEPGFVPVEERVAAFDNDGTLWAEQPIYFQVAFALDEVKRLAPQFPAWNDQEPFR